MTHIDLTTLLSLVSFLHTVEADRRLARLRSRQFLPAAHAHIHGSH